MTRGKVSSSVLFSSGSSELESLPTVFANHRIFSWVIFKNLGKTSDKFSCLCCRHPTPNELVLKEWCTPFGSCISKYWSLKQSGFSKLSNNSPRKGRWVSPQEAVGELLGWGGGKMAMSLSPLDMVVQTFSSPLIFKPIWRLAVHILPTSFSADDNFYDINSNVDIVRSNVLLWRHRSR